jgi:hypothetical protein
MLTAGVADRIVMEVCGWSDRTMLDRYQHVTDEHLDEFVELMDARHPGARATNVLSLPVRSKYAGRPHSRRKGARLDAPAAKRMTLLGNWPPASETAPEEGRFL